jgi:hypothetical protein
MKRYSTIMQEIDDKDIKAEIDSIAKKIDAIIKIVESSEVTPSDKANEEQDT